MVMSIASSSCLSHDHGEDIAADFKVVHVQSEYITYHMTSCLGVKLQILVMLCNEFIITSHIYGNISILTPKM